MEYSELTAKAQKRVEALPMMFAFSNEQFEEGCKKLGVSLQDAKKELTSIGGGGFMKTADVPLLEQAYSRNEQERKQLLDSRPGLKSAFIYELGNHEYCITYDDAETWSAVGLSIKNATPFQVEVYNEARTEYLEHANA